MHKKLLSHEIAPDDKCVEDIVNNLRSFLNTLKDEKSSLRTAKYWMMFMELVSIVRLFIRAERTGDWNLHLKATEGMLPYFAAAGHNNYAKCARLYLQASTTMCGCLQSAMDKGLFTVRRNSSLFWSGTWTDMTIEQCLMWSAKTQGGLINITHNESARSKWLLSAHILAEYSEALRSQTGLTKGTLPEQHKDMGFGRRQEDSRDLKKFIDFLAIHLRCQKMTSF